MKFLNLGSIRNKLLALIILTVTPCLSILLYSGIEQGQHLAKMAKSDVLLLTRTMAEAQKGFTQGARQMLTTLSQLPAIQNMDSRETIIIFRKVLDQNPDYYNIVLLGLDGEILASVKPLTGINLADRKHVKETLEKNDFSVGEYIMSKVGKPRPLIAFACPVLDKKNQSKGVLSATINLDVFSRFYDVSTLPDKSFLSVTDYKGIRLFYYPAMKNTNPVGKPIRSESWNIAIKNGKNGLFFGTGSDGMRRIFAYEKVCLNNENIPYLYVWAGIPEEHIFKPAKAVMMRNFIFMIFITLFSLSIAWFFGKRALTEPVGNLVALTREFSKGNLKARSPIVSNSDEIEILTTAFHDMADALRESQRTLKKNEKRFRLLMDSLDAHVFVIDMDTFEVLFINEYAIKQFGDVTGKTCWKSLQKNMEGPCPFCTNKYLQANEGKSGTSYTSEIQNTLSGQWLHATDRTIQWIDSRIVRLEIATDITDRKKNEEERERLIVQLKESMAKVKTLSGLIPICSHCKKIRDDKGYWNQIEAYISEHSDAEFSHSICQKCAKKYYPDMNLYNDK